MDRPTFLILGAPRCGTTTLFRYMEQHPDILMARPKEPHFFDAEYGSGIERYRMRHFGRWKGESALGEATPTYLFLPFVAERIAEHLPNAKLVVALRDPVARAYSHWWMFSVRGVDRLPFGDAIAQELDDPDTMARYAGADGPEKWRENREMFRRGQPLIHRDYVAMGHYAAQLRRYLDAFRKSQIHPVLMDDLAVDPESVVRDLWRFLDVDPNVPFKKVNDTNAALDSRVGPVIRMAQATGVIRLQPRIPERLRWRLKKRVMAPTRRPPMDAGIRARLEAHYEPHIKDLADLLKRDLSAWQGAKTIAR